MAKLTKSQLTQIINEEVSKMKKIETLNGQKKSLQEAIKVLEEGGDLDEISWEGLKNAFKFGGKEAGKAAGAVDKAVGDKVHAAGKAIGNKAAAVGSAVADKAHAVGSAVSNKAAAVADKAHAVGSAVSSKAAAVADTFKTGYQTLDKGLKDFGTGLDHAMTAGDVKTLKGKMQNLFISLDKMVKELNKKEEKLGMPLTTMKGLLFTTANKSKKTAPAPMAESKKAKNIK